MTLDKVIKTLKESPETLEEVKDRQISCIYVGEDYLIMCFADKNGEMLIWR